MSRSTPKRALSALTLVILLTLPAAPALAGPVGLSGSQHFTALGRVIEVLVDWAFGWWAPAHPNSLLVADPGSPPRWTGKAGPMIDPNGGSSPATTTTCGDAGPMIDPNGGCLQ
jgi:hypothetical protein